MWTYVSRGSLNTLCYSRVYKRAKSVLWNHIQGTHSQLNETEAWCKPATIGMKTTSRTPDSALTTWLGTRWPAGSDSLISTTPSPASATITAPHSALLFTHLCICQHVKQCNMQIGLTAAVAELYCSSVAYLTWGETCHAHPLDADKWIFCRLS